MYDASIKAFCSKLKKLVFKRRLSMDPTTLTLLLDDAYDGDRAAFGRIAAEVYEDFKTLAKHAIAQKGAVGDIRPTMIANDALVELMKQREAIGNREQFFALATRFMFRILAQRNREGRAHKRGGGHKQMEFQSGDGAAKDRSVELDARIEKLRSAMESLLEAHPEAAEVVTLHIMGGHPLPMVAKITELPLRTVERRWQLAKAYLATHFG